VSRLLANCGSASAKRSAAVIGVPSSCYAIVKPKHLLVNVAFKMKRLYSNVGSLKAAFQQRPEILHAVDVNPTAT